MSLPVEPLGKRLWATLRRPFNWDQEGSWAQGMVAMNNGACVLPITARPERVDGLALEETGP